MPIKLLQRAIGLIILSLLVGCASQPTTVAGKLDPILHQLDSGGAVLSARVVDLSTGAEIYSSTPDRRVVPASNMKLLSMATAVDRWEGNHPFKTYVAMDGDDLWIIGTGDPALGDPELAKQTGGTPLTTFEAWTVALKSLHVNRVKGSLIYYDGAFESQQVHPSWGRGELSAWFAAPISGLNFNDNCVDVTVAPSEPGKLARVSVMPPATQEVKIVNECTTGRGRHADITRAEDANIYTLTGSCTRPTVLKSKAVVDPGVFTADAFRTYLSSQGITVVGPTTRASSPLDGQLTPPMRKIVAVHQTLLADMLRRIGKDSQNLFAEGLCKLNGQAYNADHGSDEPGSWASGERAIRLFLSRHHIDDSALTFADGSGLSHENQVSAHLISDILVTMAKSDRFGLFENSLTVGGVDGTIGSRFKDKPGRVYAKTGYVNGVRSLSGYVLTDDNRALAFSFIFNNIHGSVKPYEHLQDEACRVLMTYPKLTYEATPATQPTSEPSE